VVPSLLIRGGQDDGAIDTQGPVPCCAAQLAKGESEARVSRRLLAIANALGGMSREDAARSAGMDRQTLRDWVIRYNAYGLDRLADQWGDGRPPKLSPEEKSELVAIVLAGPDPEASGISAFTREDLVGICKERFGKSLHVTSMGRNPARVGCRGRRRDPVTGKKTLPRRRP
jgi:transposase